MSPKSVAVAGAAAAVVLSSMAHAQVVTHRDVGAHMAMAVIAATVAKCEQNGGGITVAVVDRSGNLRGMLVADKASPHNVELAQRKAYTALTFRRTSEEWAGRTEPGSRIAGQRNLAKVIPLAGGAPLKVGEETIGAVGVSGSVKDPDEVCAAAGVAGVADQLK
jgi:uncharacterized protein GlcG (DUF336 family)